MVALLPPHKGTISTVGTVAEQGVTEEVVVVGSGLFGLTAALTTALTTAPAAVLTAAKDGRRVLVFGHLAGREAAATPLKK